MSDEMYDPLARVLRERNKALRDLVVRAVPFVNGIVVLAENKTNGLAWLADAESALPGEILSPPEVST